MSAPRLLIFGYGFIGSALGGLAASHGYDISATIRTPERGRQLDAMGIQPVPVGNHRELARAVDAASGILVCPAPTDEGCPGFAALSPQLAKSGRKWIGYLSTTGVYGDRAGGWVWEDGARAPTSAEGRRRVVAEDQWQSLDHDLNIFRLPGLYGPGRNVIEKLMAGEARRIRKPGHVFSRLHHDDCATALLASLKRGGNDIFNLCDDEPAPGDAVVTYATQLTGLPLPEAIAWDDPNLSPGARRFYADNKRVSNARAKAVLGWRPVYANYRQGLDAIWKDLKATWP